MNAPGHRAGRPLRMVDLRIGALYFSPLGKVCRLREVGSTVIYFEYLKAGRLLGDGFTLSDRNVGMMRELGP